MAVEDEHLMTFGEAVNWLPRSATGKRLHPSTLYRWSKRGLKAAGDRTVRLETTKLGGRNATSREALRRFFDKLRHGETVVQPAGHDTAMRDEMLDRLGL